MMSECILCSKVLGIGTSFWQPKESGGEHDECAEHAAARLQRISLHAVSKQ